VRVTIFAIIIYYQSAMVNIFIVIPVERLSFLLVFNIKILFLVIILVIINYFYIYYFYNFCFLFSVLVF
jgi:hypothetical protein